MLFAVDYIGTNNAPSGKLSLLYRNESVVTINPATPKAVKTDKDAATSFTMTAQNANAASVGPFEVKLTISASSPAVNTTYVGYGDAKYSVKLSLDGGEMQVDGRIDAVTYEDTEVRQGSFLSRLFG